ncbi:MAG: carbohydrate ABC transporter permease [Firmicutes bacterium]|nr:carbohydrate ABC transporter permease [Bacillota bacterium]
MPINVWRIAKSLATAAFLAVMVTIALFPLVYAILASFKDNIELFVGSASILPEQFRPDNWVQAWTRARFARYTLNSVMYSTGTTLLSVLNAAMVGYVFARGRFPGRQIVVALFTSTMFISVGSLTLYPILEMARLLHIHRGLHGLIIINGIGVNVAGYYLVSRYINTIPRELDEAAVVDGCSFFQVWLRIIFPLSKPVLATVGLLAFIGAWNEYLMPFVFTLGNPNMSTLTVGVTSLKGDAMSITAYGLMLAGSAMSLIPLIVMFIIVNRYFVHGLTSGALKG